MKNLNITLLFSGETEEAFNFYKSVFGGEFAMISRFGDGPESGQMPEEIKKKIMHIALPVGNGNLLMATDMVEGFGPSYKPGNNFNVSVQPDSWGGRQLAVEVRDHGPGLPPTAIPHLFDRFYKADSARTRSEGSGLGLAIAWENVRLHGGYIHAGNHPDGGAAFTVSLPLDGLDDGGHGADQAPEALHRPSVAGDVDLGV